MNALTAALTAMRRSPYQTIVAVLMTTLTCFVAFSFSLVLLGADRILQYFETRPQIIAFFTLDASPSHIELAQTTMQSKPYVSDVKMVSKDQALELYREDNKNDPLLLELVTADILPASIEVSGKTAADLGQIRSDLQGIEGVDDVVYQQNVIDALNMWTKALRWVGIISSIVLGGLSFLIVMVIVGMKVTAKRQAIQVMRIIGATQWYVKRPFMVEGMLYGLLGSILGWTTMFSALLYLTPQIRTFLGSINILPVPYIVLGLQAAIGMVIAMSIGATAALTAAQRQMRR